MPDFVAMAEADANLRCASKVKFAAPLSFFLNSRFSALAGYLANLKPIMMSPELVFTVRLKTWGKR
jgi:hypothetical protein